MRFVSFLALLLPCAALARQPIELTQEEFKMYRHWQKAMNDPQVEKIKPEKRNAAIAKDAKFKLAAMEKAIVRGEAAGDLKKVCEENIREAISGANAATAIGRLEVDVSEPHAVVYLQWANENLTQLEEEASVVAALTARECPIVSSIQLWAEDKSTRSRVFQALISQSAAAKINVERAKDFADTRYIRLFEAVKNIAQGDTFDAGPAGGQP